MRRSTTGSAGGAGRASGGRGIRYGMFEALTGIPYDVAVKGRQPNEKTGRLRRPVSGGDKMRPPVRIRRPQRYQPLDLLRPGGSSVTTGSTAFSLPFPDAMSPRDGLPF